MAAAAPIAVLETGRLTREFRFVTDYTLIINPWKGKSKDLTKAEAAQIIRKHGLRRFEIKHDAKRTAADGTEYYETMFDGYIWDTPNQKFRDTFSVKARIGPFLKYKKLHKDAKVPGAAKIKRRCHELYAQMFNEDITLTEDED